MRGGSAGKARFGDLAGTRKRSDLQCHATNASATPGTTNRSFARNLGTSGDTLPNVEQVAC